jgi:DNA-binding transcriptional MerR regulator
MPDDTNTEYFDITELVERANAQARELNIGELSVRAVRFYIQRGLFTKGLMVNQLPEIQQRALPHKGNQRFFTNHDVNTLVNIKGQLDAGKTVADLGGREIRESSRPSHDDDLSTRKLLFTELNASMTPLTDDIVLSAIDSHFSAPGKSVVTRSSVARVNDSPSRA